MSGPWEKYGGAAESAAPAQEGPWTAYQGGGTPAPAPAAAPAGGDPAKPATFEQRRFRPDRGEDASSLDFITGNVNKGIAGLAGLPMDTILNLRDLGTSMVGTMGPNLDAGRRGGIGMGGAAPEPTMGRREQYPLSGAWFQELMRKHNVIPPGSDPTSKGGEYAASALQMLPAAAMGRPGQIPNVPQALKTAGTAAGAGFAGQAGADVGGEEWRGVASMLPGARSMQQKPPGERATAARQSESFGKAKDMGIPIPPREMKVDKPQQSAQNVANRHLGQPEGTEVSAQSLNTYRGAHQADYLAAFKSPALAKGVVPNPKFQQEIQAIGAELDNARGALPQTFKGMKEVTKLLGEYGYGQMPAGVKGSVPPRAQPIPADVTMRAIKKLRSDATTNFSSDQPEKVQLARVQKKIANSLEDLVESNLAGDAALMGKFKEARTQMAKSYDIEAALDPATGKISGAKLATLMNEGRPLSGELRNLAEVSQSFPGAIKSPPADTGMFSKRMSPFGVTHPGAVAAHGAQRLLDPITMSRPYQSMMVDPRNRLSPEQERAMRYVMGAMGANQIPAPPQ